MPDIGDHVWCRVDNNELTKPLRTSREYEAETADLGWEDLRTDDPGKIPA
jgi:hypothetical protein